MSQSIIAKNAEITLIDTCRLQVNQESTDLRWNASKKHPDIQLLNAVVTAKLAAAKSGAKAILAQKGFVIGTASESLTYKIHQGTHVHVGFAEATRDLTSMVAASDLVSVPVVVTQDENLQMELTPTELIVTHEGKRTALDITAHVGKTMYPWLSDDPTTAAGFSVSIIKTSRLSIYIAQDGTVVFKTSADGGVDRPIKFDTGAAPLEFTGGQLITDTVHNVVESEVGTPLVLRETAGLDVTIDASANIDTPGGVACAVLSTLAVTSTGDLALNAADAVVVGAGTTVTVTYDSGSVVMDSAGLTLTAGEMVAPVFKSNAFVAEAAANVAVTEIGGLGLTISNGTGDAAFDASVTVLGSVVASDINAPVATDLNVTEIGGLGLHITTGTGVATFDSLVVAPEVRAPDTAALQLRNWAGEGITVAATGGAASCDSTLTVASTVYGASDLHLHNNDADALGVTVMAGTGDAVFDASAHITENIIALGTASIGPTAVDAGVCFAASDGTGSKAMLLPRTASHGTISPTQAGLIVFNTTNQKLYVHNGSVWQALATV